MDSDRARGRRYRLVLRGELGEPFGFLFEGMHMDQVAGTTVLTGSVIDQAHLHGLIQRTQELGLELISVQPAGEASDETERPASSPRLGAAARRNGEVVRMTPPKGEVIDIAGCGLLFAAAAAALASGSRTERATS